MERKIVDTINSPLLYITQPVYPPAKPKMQQTYVRRTSTPIPETAQVSPVQEKVVEKQVPVEAIAEDITATPLKKNPIEEKIVQRKSQIEENKQPIETRLKVETEPSAKIIEAEVVEPKQEPVKEVAETKKEPVKNKPEIKNRVEPKRDLLKELLKEKLPGLEGIAEGKPFHIQQKKTKSVEQPKQAVPEVPENPQTPEVPEVSAESQVPEEAVYSGEILEIEDQENAEKIEAAKEKRRMITTFGIRSSIEKGRKAVAPPQKQPSPITMNDIKNRKPKEQNGGEDIQQSPQNQLEEVQQEPEVKKPRHKPFKEMSVEEKVEYLINLPAAVPKVKCEIRTKETTIQGIIAGYTNGVVQIVQRKKPFRVDLKIEEILGINRKSF